MVVGTTRGGVFISYRRDDSQGWAGRLADDLREHFGDARVYRDLDSNRAAADYLRQIDEALALARVVIVVIASSWASAVDGSGRRRLEDEADLVRYEVTHSLQEDLVVVPVLVGGAAMPGPNELPAPLRRLCTIQAIRLSDDDWRYGVGRLIALLEDHAVVPMHRTKHEQAGDAAGWRQMLTTASDAATAHRQFSRTVAASRRRTHDALLATVEALGYGTIYHDGDAAWIAFDVRPETPRWLKSAGQRRGDPHAFVIARVIDASPGTEVLVEFQSARLPLMGSWDRRWTREFLDDVERVLAGQGVVGGGARKQLAKRPKSA